MEQFNSASTRKKEFFEYFQANAQSFSTYRKRFRYYWNDVGHSINYFIHEDDSVLEVACGVGRTISRLKGKNKTGIDFSPEMIGQARELFPDINFQVMDAEDIQLDQKFDVIVLSNCIGFFDDVLKVFKQLKKVSHPKTRIIINYYNYLWEPFLQLAEYLGIKKKTLKQNWLSKDDISNLLYLAGLENYRDTKRLLLPVKIPVVSWFVNKYIARLPLINSLCINQLVFARWHSNKEFGAKQEYVTSVVIPARNESGNIEAAVQRLPEFGKGVEIIFIEGNSTDDTWDKIQEIKAKYPDKNIKIGQQDGKGKGNAVRKGFAMATGDILMILDADLTVPPEDIPSFYDAIRDRKGEFINGARLVYPMEKKAMRFLNLLGNHFFSKMFSWLLERPLKDTLCGTKVLFKDDYEKLIKNRKFFGEFDPFGDFDLLFGAYKLNLKIIDLPIRYRERTYGDTNISRFRHGFILLRMCVYAAKKIKFY